MRLIDRGNIKIKIFFEISYVDDDGNILKRPVDKPVEAWAVIQPRSSGTSSGNAEQSDGGYVNEQFYRLRLARKYDRLLPVLKPSTQIEWDGVRWEIYGEPTIYQSTPRTKHIDYLIRRS